MTSKLSISLSSDVGQRGIRPSAGLFCALCSLCERHQQELQMGPRRTAWGRGRPEDQHWQLHLGELKEGWLTRLVWRHGWNIFHLTLYADILQTRRYSETRSSGWSHPVERGPWCAVTGILTGSENSATETPEYNGNPDQDRRCYVLSEGQKGPQGGSSVAEGRFPREYSWLKQAAWELICMWRSSLSQRLMLRAPLCGNKRRGSRNNPAKERAGDRGSREWSGAPEERFCKTTAATIFSTLCFSTAWPGMHAWLRAGLPHLHQDHTWVMYLLGSIVEWSEDVEGSQAMSQSNYERSDF